MDKVIQFPGVNPESVSEQAAVSTLPAKKYVLGLKKLYGDISMLAKANNLEEKTVAIDLLYMVVGNDIAKMVEEDEE